MVTWRALAVRLIVVVLAVWPLIHLGLSKTGSFSSWRFAGWGMYATAYPSSAQWPIHFLLTFSEQGAALAEPVRIFEDGKDVSRSLEVSRGLYFHSIGGPRRIDLAGTGWARQLEGLSRGVRQLDRTRYLGLLAAQIQRMLPPETIGPFQLSIIVGERRADALRGRYGTAYRLYSHRQGSNAVLPICEVFREMGRGLPHLADCPGSAG